MGVARLGSNNCFNSPAAGGSFTLWMQTVAGSDTTVSRTVSLAPGETYMVRWHYAMRHIKDTSTVNPLSSALNVSLCGTVVAANYTAPSLFFEEASSSMFTPIGNTTVTCTLAFTILRGDSALRSLLIDEVELVIVRNPNLVPSGSFEGLTESATSWSVYPGIMGNWTSNGHATGRATIVRIPSAECDNNRTIAGSYVLWFQSTSAGADATMSVNISSLIIGSTYIVRWSFALRKQGDTVFAARPLSVITFGTVRASGRIPTSEVFTTGQSQSFVASDTATTLTLSFSGSSVFVAHVLIDDVELVMVSAAPAMAGDEPVVNEYTIGASSLTLLRNYTVPNSWLTTLAAGANPEFAALSTDSTNNLYSGMSLSTGGSTCHVLEFNTDTGAYVTSFSTTCNAGSVRSLMITRGQAFAGHSGGVFQYALATDSLVRTLQWSLGSTSIVGLTANGWHFFASGNNDKAAKWRLPEWVTLTTTTSTSTTTTSTTTTPTTTSTIMPPAPTIPNANLLTPMIKLVIDSTSIFLVVLGAIFAVVVRRRNRMRRLRSKGYPPHDIESQVSTYNRGNAGSFQLTQPQRARAPNGYPPAMQRAVYLNSYPTQQAGHYPRNLSPHLANGNALGRPMGAPQRGWQGPGPRAPPNLRPNY